jgi:hypothetical protein
MTSRCSGRSFSCEVVSRRESGGALRQQCDGSRHPLVRGFREFRGICLVVRGSGPVSGRILRVCGSEGLIQRGCPQRPDRGEAQTAVDGDGRSRLTGEESAAGRASADRTVALMASPLESPHVAVRSVCDLSIDVANRVPDEALRGSPPMEGVEGGSFCVGGRRAEPR